MNQRWTLNVTDFGKIEKANIAISPFLVFVGENNSGKSYLMTLLWGIVEQMVELFTKDELPSTEAYRKCEEWVMNIQDQKELWIDSDAQQLFINWINDILHSEKENLVKKMFNFDLEIGDLTISDFSTNREMKITLLDSSMLGIEINQAYRIYYNNATINDINEARRCELIGYICANLLLGDYFDDYHPLFLPASRTGFMLTYKSLARNIVERGLTYERKKASIPNLKLSYPTTKFLSGLLDLEFATDGTPYSHVVEYLEKQVLLGQIKKDDSPIQNYLYQPKESKGELPLHVASSLVAEVSPIALFLKSELDYDLMVIEEPEAHLHLKMQKKMANALIRLVNSGLPVWITTHSETIFQQVNNMIKLYNNTQRDALSEKFGYEKMDWLDPSIVSAYQFVMQDNGKTSVEPLELTQYGFVVPTLNQEIANLTLEAYALQERDTDAD